MITQTIPTTKKTNTTIRKKKTIPYSNNQSILNGKNNDTTSPYGVHNWYYYMDDSTHKTLLKSMEQDKEREKWYNKPAEWAKSKAEEYEKYGKNINKLYIWKNDKLVRNPNWTPKDYARMLAAGTGEFGYGFTESMLRFPVDLYYLGKSGYKGGKWLLTSDNIKEPTKQYIQTLPSTPDRDWETKH